MPALRFKTCRLLEGNVWNRELTIEKQILVIYAAVNGFCDRMPLERIYLLWVKITIFLVLANLALDISYVFVDDLSRAVQQFYPTPLGEGLGSPTPPPGNSGVELFPAAGSQEPPDAETQQARSKLVTLLEKLLIKYKNHKKTAEENAAFEVDEIPGFAKRIAVEELHMESKPATEVAGLTTFIKNMSKATPLFNRFFSNHFFKEDKKLK